jgi:transcriptional regulator with XRE-family HTH domain
VPAARRHLSLQQAFGKAVRARREALPDSVSQEDLGDLAELHRTYISEIERGLKNPSLTTIARLATALKVKASTLVADVEQLM